MVRTTLPSLVVLEEVVRTTLPSLVVLEEVVRTTLPSLVVLEEEVTLTKKLSSLPSAKYSGKQSKMQPVWIWMSPIQRILATHLVLKGRFMMESKLKLVGCSVPRKKDSLTLHHLVPPILHHLVPPIRLVVLLDHKTKNRLVDLRPLTYRMVLGMFHQLLQHTRTGLWLNHCWRRQGTKPRGLFLKT